MAEDKGRLKGKSNTSWTVYYARKQLNRTDTEADSEMLLIWRMILHRQQQSSMFLKP